MELWIRSQDKRNLKKINTEIYIREGLSNYAEGDVYFIVSSGTELGEYKTKERALEVLDEIQNILSGNCILKSYDNVTPEFSENLIINPCEVHIEQLNTYVYKMPED